MILCQEISILFPDTQRAGPSSFADELAARIKGEAVGRTEGDRACKSLSTLPIC